MASPFYHMTVFGIPLKFGSEYFKNVVFFVFTLQTQWPAVRTNLLFIKEPPHKASIGFIQILATQGCIHNLRQRLKCELRLP